jgi:excisionase family DNA binding protein
MVTTTAAPSGAIHPSPPGNAAKPGALSLEEAAPLLGCKYSKAKELARSGELRTFTIGRLRRTTYAAITDYHARREAIEAEKHEHEAHG